MSGRSLSVLRPDQAATESSDEGTAVLRRSVFRTAVTRPGAPYVLVALAIPLARFAIVALMPRHLVGTLFEDDAFYYFRIARNIALGHGSTYDGVNSTNGYQPLWLAVLVP